MKIDPNQPIEHRVEFILCEGGKIVLHDGGSSALDELERDGSAFQKFCRSLDPNKCFISALIPNDADRQVFFKAREAAKKSGIYMQALVDTPERHYKMWKDYIKSKQYADANEKESE